MTLPEDEGSATGVGTLALDAPPPPSSDGALSVTEPPPARTFSEPPAVSSIPIIVSSADIDTQSEPTTAVLAGQAPAPLPVPPAFRISVTASPGDDARRRSGGFSAVEVPTLETLFSPEPNQGITSEHPGRYATIGLIGAGSGGVVSLERDLHLTREIAVKELNPGISVGFGITGSLSPAEIRFIQQARLTARLEHPGVVSVHELGRRADGTLYYAMALVRGRTLAQALAGRPLCERLALIPRFAALCEAIAYAHSRGIIHRDLHPEGITVGEFGETVVLDWGFAMARGEQDVHSAALVARLQQLVSSSASWTAPGALPYMSPEQTRGEIEQISERSDVYSLGAILFHLLTGSPPFSGATAADVAQAIVQQPVPDPLEWEPRCPPPLAAIAVRALSKRPLRRHTNAQAFSREVQEYVVGAIVGPEYRRLDQRLQRSLHRQGVRFLFLLPLLIAVALAGLLLAR